MDEATRQAKAEELAAFLETNADRLRINMPSRSKDIDVTDTMSSEDPEWPNEVSPDKFARILVQRYPELRFEWSGGEEESEQDAPATDKQVAYLKVLEVPISGYLTMREASDLIDKYKDRISEGQKRRLDFYGLKYPPDITREQATSLIDVYKSEHPESEEAYKAWKTSQGIA